MADVTGAMLTTNVLSDQLAIDLGDRISELEPNWQVLSVFTRAADKRATEATKFSGLESRSKARFDATSAAVASTSATTIPVDHGAYFAQWDLVLNTRTGELFRVDGVSANDLTVTRGLQATVGTGIAILENDELLITGSAQPENDTSKPARNNIPTKITNYTQIVRNPFELSDSLRASGFQVGPAEWPRQAREHMKDHAKDIEYTLLFGRKSLTTPGSSETRTSGGLLSFITTNQTDAGGDLSEAEFNAFLAQVMRYGSGSKLAMGSAVAVGALNKFPASKQQVASSEKSYGMNVSHYTSPFGSLNLVYHRLMEGTKYGGYLIVADMDNVAYRYLANSELNRDTKLLQNRQPNDQDGRKDEYLTEMGLEVNVQETHGVLTGITS